MNKMRDMCEHDINVYSEEHMKRKLADHFGSRIVIASINGKADVVTFRSNASTHLLEFYDTPKHSKWEEEKLRIVQLLPTSTRLTSNVSWYQNIHT